MQQVSLSWPIVSFVTTDYKHSFRLEKEILAIKLKSCINLQRRGALVCCHWSFRGARRANFQACFWLNIAITLGAIDGRSLQFTFVPLTNFGGLTCLGCWCGVPHINPHYAVERRIGGVAMKRSGMSCPTLRGKCPIFNFFITCFIMELLNFTTSESTPKGVIGNYWNVSKIKDNY